MVKKEISIIVFILLASSIVFVIQPIVKADTISNVSVSLGAVSVIVLFECDAGYENSTYRIYFGKSSGIATSDNTTMQQGGVKGNGDIIYNIDNFSNINRKILIRGLTENTLYYYRIYDVTNTAWCASESSFTTLPRFINQWKDEFFDEYLIEANNSIQLVQQEGIHLGYPMTGLNKSGAGGSENEYGYNYCTIIYNESLSKYEFWGTGIKPVTGQTLWYSNSSDGITWEDAIQLTVTDIGNRLWGGVNRGSDGSYICVYSGSSAINPAYNLALARANQSNGLFVTQNPNCLIFGSSNYGTTSMGNIYDYSEMHSGGIINDTLGAQMWFGAGQGTMAPGTPCGCRRIGFWYGLNDTDWRAYNEVSDGQKGFEIPMVTTDTHDFPHYIDSGVYVGINSDYNEDGDDLIRPYLCTSRSGYGTWSNFNDSKPIIPIEGNPGDWDGGFILVFSYPHIEVGDLEYLYFTQHDNVHEYTPWSANQTRIGWRIDGMTALEPQAADTWFRTTTIPGKFNGEFIVNGNFTSTAKLNISVIDANTSTVYPGFAFADFDTITINSTSITPSWGSNSIRNIPDGDFKLNFSWDGMGSGEFYSYYLNADESAPYFISIDGEGNQTSIYNSTPTFIWSKINNTGQYQLQIANDSGFTDLVVNLQDINEINYPTEFNEATNITFTLPTANTLWGLRTYYCRVRSYTR